MNKNLKIDNKIFINYFSLQKNIYEKLIWQDLNKAILVTIDQNEKYVRFKDKQCVVFTCDKFTILNINIVNYNDLIPNDFLNDLITNKNKLNFKLSRLAEFDYIDVLKQEIIDALIFNRIDFEYNKQSDFIIASWKSLKTKFMLLNDFTFSKLMLE